MLPRLLLNTKNSLKQAQTACKYLFLFEGKKNPRLKPSAGARSKPAQQAVPSNSKDFRAPALMVWDLQCLDGSERKDHSMNELMSE